VAFRRFKASGFTVYGLTFQKERVVTQIYVGNLAYGATEDDLRQKFSEFGQVSAVNVITDRQTGRPRGFAFVEMPNAAEAKQAIETLNLQEIAGRAVTVNEARPKPDRPNKGGGGGGGGGRGRRSW
jgi:RNA recognition motif-containing protein